MKTDEKRTVLICGHPFDVTLTEGPQLAYYHADRKMYPLYETKMAVFGGFLGHAAAFFPPDAPDGIIMWPGHPPREFDAVTEDDMKLFRDKVRAWDDYHNV